MVQMRLGVVTTEQCLADSQADDDRDDEPDLVRPKKARKKEYVFVRGKRALEGGKKGGVRT